MKLIKQEFIFGEPLPTPECHASTILVREDGRKLAAWFAGTKEANPDVLIFVSRFDGECWSAPRAVTPEVGVQHWNPVLFLRENGEIILYFKYGKPIPKWVTYYCISKDGGKSFSEPKVLVEGDFDGGRGPVKNKAIRLSDGTVIAPASKEDFKIKRNWKCFVDISKDDGLTFEHSNFVIRPKKNLRPVSMIQPTLWEDSTGVHMLIRSNAGKIYKSDSADFGMTWCKAYETPYPNPNSGIDLVKLEDETVVLCMNPVGADWGNRAPLVLMRSFDGGNTFEEFFKLEDIKGDYEFSYPAITAVGKTLHITYTHERKTIIYWQVENE